MLNAALPASDPRFTPETVNVTIESSNAKWQSMLRDGLAIADKIHSSVERNRLKLLLRKLNAETPDFTKIDANNPIHDCYVRTQWEWINSKLKKRLASIQQYLPDNQDRFLISRLLEALIAESQTRLPPEPPSAANDRPVNSETRFAQSPELRQYLKQKLPEVKKQLGDFSPSVFISYAWGPEEKMFANHLTEDLRLSGIDVRFDLTHNGPSTAIATDFMDTITEVDYVIPICSERMGEKYRAGKNNFLFIELRIIADRYRVQPNRVLPILLTGTLKDSVPIFLRDVYVLQFTEPRDYVKKLSALILALCKYADDTEGLQAVLDKIVQEAPPQ